MLKNLSTKIKTYRTKNVIVSIYLELRHSFNENFDRLYYLCKGKQINAKMRSVEGHISISLLHFLYNIVRDYRRMCVVKKNCSFRNMNYHFHDNSTEIKIIKYNRYSRKKISYEICQFTAKKATIYIYMCV